MTTLIIAVFVVFVYALGVLAIVYIHRQENKKPPNLGG